MPNYEYRCTICGEVNDHHVPMANRLERQDCPKCKREKSAEYQISAPLLGTEKPVGDGRIIRSERQLDPRWRDKGTTGRPGGVGRKIIFH